MSPPSLKSEAQVVDKMVENAFVQHLYVTCLQCRERRGPAERWWFIEAISERARAAGNIFKLH